MGAQLGWKLGELADAPVNGACECAFIHFVVVACVERHHGAACVIVPLGQPALQVCGLDGGCTAMGRANRRVTHADDFGLDHHAHLAKRHGARPALLGGHIGKAHIGAQGVHPAMHGFGRACQKEVDAFFCQQYRALERPLRRTLGQQLAQLLRIRQRNELVAGDVQNVGHGRESIKLIAKSALQVGARRLFYLYRILNRSVGRVLCQGLQKLGVGAVQAQVGVVL
ncbi:hypothetical protein D3C72_1398050 [compost metagenome]